MAGSAQDWEGAEAGHSMTGGQQCQKSLRGTSCRNAAEPGSMRLTQDQQAVPAPGLQPWDDWQNMRGRQVCVGSGLE